MALDIAEAVFGLIFDLVFGAVKTRVETIGESFFTQRRVRRALEAAVEQVVQPLLPFMRDEGLTTEQQLLLISTCIDELRILTIEPDRLFRGSLQGHLAFEQLYVKARLPQAILDEGLETVYTMTGQRIATLLCELPMAVEGWRIEKWREDYRRLDEIAGNLRTLFLRVDAIASSAIEQTDSVLRLARRIMTQKMGLELDMTGLRSERPLSCGFDEIFTHPLLTQPSGTSRVDIKDEEQSIRAFLRAGRRAVLIGSPGAGKSTWTKWLLRQSMGERWPGVGVRVELRRFATIEPQSLQEMLRETVGLHLADQLDASRIYQWTSAGRIMFILDGFDEIPPHRRDLVHRWILDLADMAFQCSIIVTSRPLTTDHISNLSFSWGCWTIQPFDRERVIRYVNRWYRYAPLLADSDRIVNAESLTDTWQSDPTIRPLTINPLLLSTLLVVHHLDGRLPTGRAQLYRRYVDGMLGGWDDRRSVAATSIQLATDQKQRLLRGLAIFMHTREQDQLDEQTIKGLLRKLLTGMGLAAEAEEILSLLRERSGLLVGPGTYSFAHKTIEEYLVASAIVQGDQSDEHNKRVDRFMLFGHRHEDRWGTTLSLWAGLAGVHEVEDFIEESIKLGEWREFNRMFPILRDYDTRFATNFRARVLKHLISISNTRQIPEDLRDVLVFLSPFPSIERRPAVTSIPCVGIGTNDFNLYHLLRLWHTRGEFCWQDVAEAKGPVLDMLWIICATCPRDLSHWSECIKKPPQGQDQGEHKESVRVQATDRSVWTIAAFYNAIIDVSSQSTAPISIKDLLAAFRSAVPEHTGVAPFVLISACMGLTENGPRSLQTILFETLSALADGPAYNINERWLEGSRHFSIGDVTYDLLQSFAAVTKRLSSGDLLAFDASFSNGLAYVEHLTAQRSGLR